MSKNAFLTWEDIKTCFNLFCAVYGIGTLGMPGNFSRAGPVLGVLGLAVMACINVYASVLISKVMLLAPPYVKTFGDIGEWAMGKPGRFLIVFAQIGNILMLCCAFLILGGNLLDDLFPNAFDKRVWIVIMAMSVTPMCLVPTLKEGAGAAFAGCLGTLVADLIGVAIVMHAMRGHPPVPGPKLSFEQVASMFGNLCVAYGAGTIIPALQRQHSDPTRMPRIIVVTLVTISILFLGLAASVYSAVGCQISGNLLFSIVEDSLTGWSKLDFHSHKGAVILAYLGMQMHITIAFSVNLHPAFFVFERMFLGMHKVTASDLECSNYHAHGTPREVELQSMDSRTSKHAMVSMPEDMDAPSTDESAEYRGTNAVRYVILRLVMITCMVVVAMIFSSKFMEYADVMGASMNVTSCIILPIVFYMLVMWHHVPMYEKVIGITAALLCCVLGAYVTFTVGRDLIFGGSHAKFPFCPTIGYAEGPYGRYGPVNLQETIYYTHRRQDL